MSLTIPYTFTGGIGHKAKASEVNANFQAVANKFTEGAGGIGNGDIATGAGIVGTKISNTLGSRIPSDRLEPGAVDATALKSSTGGTNGAVATADHIKDGIITSAKLVPDTLLAGKGKILTYSVACNTLFGASSLNALSSKISTVNVPATAGRDRTSLVPLGIYIERTGGSTLSDSVGAPLVAKVLTNSVDSIVYFSISNVLNVAHDLTSFTLNFVYWSKT